MDQEYIFTTLDWVELVITNNTAYYVAASGGYVAVQRKDNNDEWVDVEGSPVPNGAERELKTYSSNSTVRFKPSDIGTRFVVKDA